MGFLDDWEMRAPRDFPWLNFLEDTNQLKTLSSFGSCPHSHGPTTSVRKLVQSPTGTNFRTVGAFFATVN